MFPKITIFNKEITMYAVMSLIGILAAGFYAVKKTKEKKQDDNDMIITLLISAIGVFIGGHLLYAIVGYEDVITFLKSIGNTNIKETLQLFITAFSGSVFYGGLIGGLIFGSIYIKRKKLDKSFYDIAAPTIPLFHFFARIGCFLVGCCYGIESKIGFTYQNSMVPIANGVTRFPVQLLEALLNLVLFIVLNHLLNKGKYKNKLIYIYLLSYAIIRFALEFLRGDLYRGFIGVLSTSQIISLIIIISIVVLKIINIRRKK